VGHSSKRWVQKKTIDTSKTGVPLSTPLGQASGRPHKASAIQYQYHMQQQPATPVATGDETVLQAGDTLQQASTAALQVVHHRTNKVPREKKNAIKGARPKRLADEGFGRVFRPKHLWSTICNQAVVVQSHLFKIGHKAYPA